MAYVSRENPPARYSGISGAGLASILGTKKHVGACLKVKTYTFVTNLMVRTFGIQTTEIPPLLSGQSLS